MHTNLHRTIKQEVDDAEVETGGYLYSDERHETFTNSSNKNFLDTKFDLTRGSWSNDSFNIKTENGFQTDMKSENDIPVQKRPSKTSQSLCSNDGRNSPEVNECVSAKGIENVVANISSKIMYSAETENTSKSLPELIVSEDMIPDEAEDSIGGKKFKCKICNKLFVKKSNLRAHELTHTGETPYKCQFCNKGFNVRSNLNVHLRIHTGQRPHECEICKKSFRQAGQLKTHQRIHKGEKPYQCHICSGSFRSSSSLITHLRTHTGEKPFPCDLCSRSFTTSTSLKTHRVTHLGTMLYDCPVCGRQFNRRNNLNVHIKRHNKNRKFSCPMCSNGFVMRAHLLSHLKRWHNVYVNSNDLKQENVYDVTEFHSKTAEDEKVHCDLNENVDVDSKVKDVNFDTTVWSHGTDNVKDNDIDKSVKTKDETFQVKTEDLKAF